MIFFPSKLSYSIVNINCIKIKNNKNPGNFKFSCSNKIKTHALIFYVSPRAAMTFCTRFGMESTKFLQMFWTSVSSIQI